MGTLNPTHSLTHSLQATTGGRHVCRMRYLDGTYLDKRLLQTDSDDRTFACPAVRVEFVADLALAAISADRVDTDVLAAVILCLALVILYSDNIRTASLTRASDTAR